MSTQKLLPLLWVGISVFVLRDVAASSIVFTSARRGQLGEIRLADIYVMTFDGGNVEQLTDNEKIGGLSSKPNFSPDGRHIVYEQVIRNAGQQIYIIDAKTRAARNFLPQRIGENNAISRYNPRFSPDEKNVLYLEVEFLVEPGAILRTANRLIGVNNRGKGRKVLKTPRNWRVDGASWATQGTELLITAMPNGLGRLLVPPNLDIYRYRLSTGQLTQLTNHPDRDSTPHWTRHARSVSSQGKVKTQWGAIKRKK